MNCASDERIDFCGIRHDTDRVWCVWIDGFSVRGLATELGNEVALEVRDAVLEGVALEHAPIGVYRQPEERHRGPKSGTESQSPHRLGFAPV